VLPGLSEATNRRYVANAVACQSTVFVAGGFPGFFAMDPTVPGSCLSHISCRNGSDSARSLPRPVAHISAEAFEFQVRSMEVGFGTTRSCVIIVRRGAFRGQFDTSAPMSATRNSAEDVDRGAEILAVVALRVGAGHANNNLSDRKSLLKHQLHSKTRSASPFVPSTRPRTPDELPSFVALAPDANDSTRFKMSCCSGIEVAV